MNSDFFLPKKDSNKLKCLEAEIQHAENGNVMLILNKEDIREIESHSNTFEVRDLIDEIDNISSNRDRKAIDSFSAINHVILLSYFWNNLGSDDNKERILIFLLHLIEYKGIDDRLLLDVLIFCVSNILFQEFDLLVTKLEDKKGIDFKIIASAKTKNKRHVKQKSKRLNFESDESRSDHEYSDSYDNVRFEYRRDENKHKRNTCEFYYILYKKLADTLCSDRFTIGSISSAEAEWLTILSLRIVNVVQIIDEMDMSDTDDSSFLCGNWEEISERLLIKMIVSTSSRKGDDINYEGQNESNFKCIFDIILNCILNSSIDIVSNINDCLGASSKNNKLNKNFGNYLSRIICGTEDRMCGSKLLTHIFEQLELYWRKIDGINDLEEDSQFIMFLINIMENISKACPKIVLENVFLIRKTMKVMISHKLRSCFIISITNSLISATDNGGRDLENRSQVIETLDLLVERMYDSHQSCRTKAIQCLQKLMENNLIPYTFFIPLLKEAKTRTLDESSYVRSSSFGLLRTIVRRATENYYQLSLNHDNICSLIENVQGKITELNREKILNVNRNILGNISKDELEVDNVGGDKKETEYELMNILLSDAKEVSLVFETIIDEISIHGIYSKISSDVCSCILFICECASLNIKKGLTHIPSVFKCIWRLNNPSVVNSVIHGFYIIISENSSSMVSMENHENEGSCELEAEDGKMSISRNCVKRLNRVLLNSTEDDLLNIMKILELLSSSNSSSGNANIVSKKYTNNFDIMLLRKYTLDEIIELKDKIFCSDAAEHNYISLVEFYVVILKVIVTNNGKLFESNDRDVSLFYSILVDSIKNNNLKITESTVKCFGLMNICDDYENKLINLYFKILTFSSAGIYKHSLLTKVIDSAFILLCNPSKIKYIKSKKDGHNEFLIDIFIKRLYEYYHDNDLGSSDRELTLIKLSQIIITLSHITLKYGNYIENIYSKWKKLHSIYSKNENNGISKENRECGDTGLNEEYLEYAQQILEDNLISNNSVFNMIVPLVNILTRDPNILLIEESSEIVPHYAQWQIDYSRNCSLIALCKLVSISTKLLSINQELIDYNYLNYNVKLSNLLNTVPNIQLIFTLLYNPSSIGYMDEYQLKDIRLNLILCTNDLLTRYPNIMDPWMERQYSLLNDNDVQKDTFKYSIMLVLNYLLNIGFVKPRDELLLSYLKCIHNSEFNTQVSSLSNSFFQEFFKDVNNQLSTNVIPSLINYLSTDYSNSSGNRDLMQMTLQQMQYLLQFVSGKETACCTLIPKLISRMSKTNDEKSLEFYIYSLEALKINSKAKCIGKIVDNIQLVRFHIQEFDFVKQFFHKIVQNYLSTNTDENSLLKSLFE